MRTAVRFVLLTVLLGYVATAFAAVTVNVNGSSYTIPQTNERGWGTNVTTWIQAISANTLQPSGGTFTLTADTNFGANYGLVSTYFKSRSSSIATAGIFRLANTDTIGWRNAADSGNLLLSVDSSNRLLFNGSLVPTLATSDFTDSGFTVSDDGDSTKKLAFQVSGVTTATTRTLTVPDASGTITLNTATQTLTNKTLTSPVISTISNTGTLTLPTSTDTMVGRATTDTLTNKTISGSSNTITNVSLSSGVTGTLPIANGGTGQTTASAGFDALSPNTTKGDITVRTSTTNARLAVGTDGQALVADSGQTTGVKWASIVTNPMTTGGDLIYGGASGTPTRLANGSSGQVLTSAGGTSAPTWSSLTVITGGTTERVERATVRCYSSSSISSQSGSWISSIGNIASGHCTVTMSSFSASPSCVISGNFHDATNIYLLEANVSSSSTLTIGCHFTASGSASANCGDYTVNVMCMGPR